MKQLRLFVLTVLAVAFLLSCSSSTKLTATWKADPSGSYQFRNIAIIGIANKPEVRKSIEDALEYNLDSRGFNTTGALMFLPPNASKENITREIVVEFLKAGKFDAVITIGLVKKEETSEYVPGQYYYTPYYNAPFYDYYGMAGSYGYSPGYYIENVSYLLQTNLYNFPEGKFLWSAQTNTTPLKELSETAAALAVTLAEELVNSKTIVP
jgi:hypothetical protein